MFEAHPLSRYVFDCAISHNRMPAKCKNFNNGGVKRNGFSSLIEIAFCRVVPFEMHLIANKKE